MSKKEAVMVGVSHWPTELVAKAEYEFALFDKPSIDTCNELLSEVKTLREKLKTANHILKRIHELEKCGNLGRHDNSPFEYQLEQIEEYLKN